MRLNLLAATAFSAVLYAAPIPISGTGVGLSSSTVDPNWTIAAGPLGPTSLTVIPDLGPIFAYWTNNGPGAKWITPTGNPLDFLPPGDYTFRTTFDLTGLIANTGSFTGTFFADNTVADIRINGVSLGISGGGFKDPTNFVLNCGVICTAGANTLDFVVTNTSSSSSPLGLRVDIAGTADAASAPPPTGVPEPSSFLMLGAGCALFAFARLGGRRKN
jgi:hypothetical protein